MNVFLKNKNYRRFSIASFLSSTGDILFYLAFMTYASKLHNYSLALSLIAISESIPKLFEIFAGYLADRTKNKFKNIFLMAIARFLLYGIVGLLFASQISDWNLVLAVVFINLLSDSFGSYSGGLVSPLITDIVGKEEFGEAEGFTGGISQIINMVAQFIGSGLLLFLSYSNLAFLNAFTFLVAGLLYASVGLNQRKTEKQAEEVNNQNFFTTMKDAFTQVKSSQGLLTIVLVVALINGALGAMSSLVPIVIAGNKSTMIIGSYSFTMALMGVFASCGAALGSMFGPQLFKKVSAFTMTIVAVMLSLLTTLAALSGNIYAILPSFFALAASASIASIKLTQWLVNTVERKILASSMGLLNTIVMAASPAMTTVFTTISGLGNVKYALIALLVVEMLVLAIASKISLKINISKVNLDKQATETTK
ncbi:MFS family permease [Lactobacillus colini]|uniref:MFS family permease n=1 Tax=Lactobacillus colini TaxID=1819254 RepID=A0ABS4MHC3_9LACO|nr:MFS transporter [Lactobacillus colini]MBP2058741.1 MFS family permease [Lactobacillus colini]